MYIYYHWVVDTKFDLDVDLYYLNYLGMYIYYFCVIYIKYVLYVDFFYLIRAFLWRIVMYSSLPTCF